MATRGYIKLVNPEKGSSDPYYGTTDDILVEAYHDGYFEDMIQHLVRIPERMLEFNNAGFGSVFFKAGHPYHYFTGDRPQKEYTFESYMRMCDNLNHPFTCDFMSILELLQITKPHQFSLVFPGAERYGSPIGFEDAHISVSVPKDDGETIIDLDFAAHFEGDGELYDDDVMCVQMTAEDFCRKRIGEYIAATNTKLGLKNHCLTFEGNQIKVPIIKGFLEAFWNHHHNATS